MSNTVNIYKDGMIYEDVQEQSGQTINKETLYGANYSIRFHVQEPHGFKNGQEVREGVDYEKRWQIKNTSSHKLWYDTSEGIYNFTKDEYRRIIATPLTPTTEQGKEYPIGGYAPGTYMCICTTCKEQFMGDKRAVQCEPCAIKMSEGKEVSAMRELIEFIDFSLINFRKHGKEDSEFNKGAIENLTVIKEQATELLEKEKHQHYNTFVAGDNRGKGNIPFNAEQYFEQTYN